MKKNILLLATFILSVCELFATHNLGGVITYTYEGDATHLYRYRITLTTYTNTNPATTAVDRCEIMLCFGDGDSSMVPRTNGPSTLCPTTHDGEQLNALLGVTYYTNIKKNIYDTIHDFPGPGAYTICFMDANRTGGICNIAGGSSGGLMFALQSTLVINNILGPNNGPQYNAVPVISDTVGVISYFNPLAIDSDGDSLYYEIDTPYQAMGSLVPLYTPIPASTSFGINNFTGTVTWDAPVMICLYVFDVKITEYRHVGGNYFYIGTTMEECWNRAAMPYLAVDEETNFESLKVFPNPANDKIKFRMNKKQENQKHSLYITNALGQTVKHIDFTSDTDIEISICDFNNGIYFYQITSPLHQNTNGKFTVLR